MSKSKNTIDPNMINQYGADAVRWFILSDSPPEKDVQWSDTGVVSANKFLQKIWNLNYEVSKREKVSVNKKKELSFISKMNNFIFKIDSSINNFRFNVSIALFYEVYKFLKDSIETEISNEIIRENMTNIMKLMIPFTPHLAHECLELHNCKSINDWPKFKKESLEEIKIAVQINGKTRDIITIKKDLTEQEIFKHITLNSTAKKYLLDKKIHKTIFVKNKIINYILPN